MGVRQFLESEKKMRVKFLAKKCKLNFKDIRQVFKDSKGPEKDDQMNADVLEVLVELYDSDTQFSDKFSVEEGEEGIVFFVAGYAARSLVKKTSCKACIPLLKMGDNSPRN